MLGTVCSADQLRGYHPARLCEERTCLFKRGGVHLLRQGLIGILESTGLLLPWSLASLVSGGLALTELVENCFFIAKCHEIYNIQYATYI